MLSWVDILIAVGFFTLVITVSMLKSRREENSADYFLAGRGLIVVPGIIANQLYGPRLATPDEAYPMLIRTVIPVGIRGFMFAAIAGAVISSLASMLNSASTIFTMDLYREYLNRRASQRMLVVMGQVSMSWAM